MGGKVSKERQKEYRELNKEMIAAGKKSWYLKNKDNIAANELD